MKQLSLLILSFFYFQIYAQSPNYDWGEDFGRLHHFSKTNDGGFILTNFTSTYGMEVFSYVKKIDGHGQEVWHKDLIYDQSINFHAASNSYQTADGKYLSVGASLNNVHESSGNHGLRDFWVVRYDDMGNVLWNKSYGGSLNELANGMVETDEGEFIIFGSSESSDFDVSHNYGGMDIWVIKINSNGDLIWEKSFGGSNDEIGIGFADGNRNLEIIKTQDGNFMIAGFTKSDDGIFTENKGGNDFMLIKFDTHGNLIWQKTYGGSGEDYLAGIIELDDGNFIVVGSTNSSDGSLTENFGGFDTWVARISENGDLIWSKSIGESLDDWLLSIRKFDSQGFIIGGFSKYQVSDNFVTNKGKLVHLDINGNLLHTKFFDQHYNIWFRSIEILENQSIILNGQMDTYTLMKLAPNFMENQMVDVKSIQIYPNPSKNILFFSEELKDIEIYNSLGQKIRNFEKGTHINLSSLPKGTYRLKAKSSSQKSIQHTFIKH